MDAVSPVAPEATISWRGFSLRGDSASVAEVRRLIEDADRAAYWRTEAMRLRGVVARGLCA